MSKKIEISDVVAKALKASKRTADDLLREALNIKAEGLTVAEGVVLPEGTSLMAWYKDRPYWCEVKNGAIEFMGERFTSVSAAAVKVTKRPTNGWEFWQCKVNGKSDFVRMSKLRH